MRTRSSGLQLGPVMALISGPTIAEAIGDPGSQLAQLVAKEPDDRKLIGEIFLRIMNRPVTDAEIDASLKSVQSIQDDHLRLHKLLAEREIAVAPIRIEQERKREEAIAAAGTALAAYQKELAPKLAEDEKLRAEGIAMRDAELKKYEASLPTVLAEWEKGQTDGTEWIPLSPASVTAPQGVTATIQPDRSIFAQGKGRGDYTVEVTTELRGIAAIRLEAIADERLPSGGPGLADDGNFVLNELGLNAQSVADANKKGKVGLQKAQVDFVQKGFNAAQAIDGNPNDGQGWASSPAVGSSHLMVVECKEPVGYEGGTKLSFTLRHTYTGDKFLLGRFRISVSLKPPAKLGVPDDIAGHHQNSGGRAGQAAGSAGEILPRHRRRAAQAARGFGRGQPAAAGRCKAQGIAGASGPGQPARAAGQPAEAAA